ncbi:hypothetical protein [Streptomyces sp. NPDC005538]|uniref:hypothetical protein n=1 Tax=Streptomyces sp. NPDC005538 TaxID=3157043 RepID=UPI0033AD24AF
MTQSQRWMDSLNPEDLTVEVNAGLTIQATHPVNWKKHEQPIACPWCHTTTGLTLRTGARDAVIHCPENHAWTDSSLPTAVVPQLYALSKRDNIPANEPFRIPETVQGVWLWLLPSSDAPGLPSTPANPLPTPGIPWARRLEDLELRDPARPLLLRSALLSWGLLAWALPHHGTLIERLVLDPRGGRDARTAGMALRHLLHDTAVNGQLPTTASGERGKGDPLMTLDLADLAARLNPDDTSTAPLREKLKTPPPDVMGVLTNADATWLRECSSQEWAEACALAYLALSVHLRHARIARAYTTGYGSLAAFVRPRLLDCWAIAIETPS